MIDRDFEMQIDAAYDENIGFKHVLKQRIELIQNLYDRKSAEYGKGLNPFHNFDKAAEINNTSPEKALCGMLTKHLVSILDIVEATENKNFACAPEIFQEKIGDNIQYNILLEGLLMRRYYQNTVKHATNTNR